MYAMDDTAEKKQPPMVSIDGARIKGLRESRKLTQLYVASVVGVTTDTISRWENNRYPSIKRENAERLALALEAGIADILRSEMADIPDAIAAPPLKRRPAAYMALALVLILLGGVTWYFIRQGAGIASVSRMLPRYSAPGSVMPVRLNVTLGEKGRSGVIVKERLPAGWRLVGAIPRSTSGEGAVDEVKWLIPAGAERFTISYTLRVPAGAQLNSKGEFSGEIVLSSGGGKRSEKVSGDDKLTVAPYHWADANGDGRIDDAEIMPAYYLTDELKGLGLEWPVIEAIWSGKSYRWDPRAGFVVVK